MRSLFIPGWILPLLLAAQDGGPFIQAGLSAGLDEGGSWSENIQVGHTFQRENADHGIGAVVEAVQEPGEQYLLLGIVYNAGLSVTDELRIVLGAEAKIEPVSDGRIVLEQDLALDHSLTERLSVQAGPGLQFSDEDRFTRPAPEIDIAFSYQF